MKFVRFERSLLLASMIAAATGWTLYWSRGRELAEQRGAILGSNERATLQRRIWASEKKARELEAGVASARVMKDVGIGPDAGNRTGSDMVAGYLALMNDPKALAIMDTVQRGEVERRYAGLFQKLHLPPAQLAALQELLLKRQNASNDAVLSMVQQGLNPLQHPAELQSLLKTAAGEVEDEIQSSLGTDKYRQYREYLAGESQRAIVNRLRQNLSYTDAPLSAPQAEQLGKLLAQPAVATEGAPQSKTLISDQVLRGAETVLAPAQVKVLESLRRQQEAEIELRQLYARSQEKPASDLGTKVTTSTEP